MIMIDVGDKTLTYLQRGTSVSAAKIEQSLEYLCSPAFRVVFCMLVMVENEDNAGSSNIPGNRRRH